MYGAMATRLYEREGIDRQHIHHISNMNTSVGFVTLLPNGENWIVVDLGANMAMTPQHVNAAEALIAQSDVVMTQLEVPLETMARAMELGRRHGAMTILNPAPAKPIQPYMLTHVDLLTPNETETRILQGLPPDDPTPTPELARRLLKMGVERIVVTRGNQGALIVTRDDLIEIPAVPIQAVDVTGAGDSFNAALAVGLGEGLSLSDAVRQATYAGAHTATHLGVIDGLPTRAELTTFKAQMQNTHEPSNL
jgi:ribokinase